MIRQALKLPELYLFLLYPLTTLIIMSCAPWFNLPAAIRGFGDIKGPLFFFLAGPVEFKIIIISCIFYSPWKAIQILLDSDQHRIRKALHFLAATLIIYSLFVLSNFINHLLLSFIGVQSTTKITEVSTQLMNLDYELFDSYPAFQIQSITPAWLGRLAINVYRQYATISLLILFLTIFLKPSAFRFLNCAMLFWLVLATPLWYFLPAVSPDELYRLRVLGLPPITPPITTAMSQLVIIPELKELLEQLAKVWSLPEKKIFAITCFPSFHVGGLLVTLYALYLISPLTLAFSIPIFLLNSLGAIYTLQHYLVDFIPAVLISLLSITFIQRICRQTNHLPLTQLLYEPLVSLNNDLRRILGKSKRALDE